MAQRGEKMVLWIASSVGGRVAVGVGTAGQPFSATFTAAMSSVISTLPLSLVSTAAQTRPSPSAAATQLTSSVTVTTPSPLQSPGQGGAGVRVGVAVGVEDGV